MLEIELVPSEAEISDNCLVVTIQITGAWNGEVWLAFSTELAHNAACRMLKLAADDVTIVDEHEVAAELTNMIGGNFKSLLPSPSQLSVPIVSPSRPAMAHRHLPPAQVVTLSAREGGLRLVIHDFAA